MKSMVIQRGLVLGCIAAAALAFACASEDEKPRPTFMSNAEEASSLGSTSDMQARTEPGAPTGLDDVPTASDAASQRGAPTNESSPPTSDGPLIVIVGDEAATNTAASTSPRTDSPAMEDDRRLASQPSADDQDDREEPREDEEEPTALLEGIAVRIPRPLPTDDLPPVTAQSPAASEPTPSQVAVATRRWAPKEPSEIERLLEREADADRDLQRNPLPDNYFDTPVPPNPNPNPGP
ncbi:MAG: hypothetical protein QF570_06805 [Myxococcota bacterium]|jgi:hypothetical protein|nr:hypothetical protein [Myxococcota bacterium]